MITAKGREEVHRLIASDLVNTWEEVDDRLKNTVRMLLSQRPDLIRLYFDPRAWQQIVQLERKESAAVILAALRTTVVLEADVPEVADWHQARFYMGTRNPRFMAMAEEWCRNHPQACDPPLRRADLKPLPIALPEPPA